MRLLLRIRRAPAGLMLLTLVTAACTTTTTQSFNVNQNSRVEKSIIAVDAEFGKYDRLLPSEMGIFFPENSAPSVDDQQRTRTIFRSAFLAEIDGYRIVDKPGPTTLGVQATLVDYRNATGADVPKVRRALADLAQPGVLMFLMELTDSESGEILARAADSASAPPFATSPGAVTDWEAVEAAANRWARLFREFLDANLKRN